MMHLPLLSSGEIACGALTIFGKSKAEFSIRKIKKVSLDNIDLYFYLTCKILNW